MRPHAHEEREGGGHWPSVGHVPRTGDHRCMALHCRGLKGMRELLVSHIRLVVAVHAADHVLHGHLECRCTGFLAAFAAAHAIGDHGDEGEPFVVQRKALLLREVGL